MPILSRAPPFHLWNGLGTVPELDFSIFRSIWNVPQPFHPFHSSPLAVPSVPSIPYDHEFCNIP